MRKSVLFLMKTLLVLSMLVFATGCPDPKDEDVGNNSGNSTEKTVPDPEGTITVSMANSGSKSKQQVRGYGLVVDDDPADVCWIAINSDNNFVTQYCQVANVGKVSGLGSITKIPNSGYSGFMSVEPQHGYVVRADTDGSYTRLYVVEWTKNTSGGITGAKVKYQRPFVP